jgi:hypothetical protein
MTEHWLLDLMKGLRNHAHWGVGINSIVNGYMLVFEDRLMVTGPKLQGCRFVKDVIDRAQIEPGPS